MIKSLYQQNKISKKNAQRMAYFCVGGGPAFIMGTVGTIMMKNVIAGVLIFISQFLSAILIGIFLRFLDKSDSLHTFSTKNTQKDHLPFTTAFTKASYEASSAMMGMCSLVIIFAVLFSTVTSLGIDRAISHILSWFSENVYCKCI